MRLTPTTVLEILGGRGENVGLIIRAGNLGTIPNVAQIKSGHGPGVRWQLGQN